MASNGFFTTELRKQHRFDAWHEWFSPVIEVMSPPPEDDRFFATNRVWDLGGLVVSCVSAPPVRVKRSKANIRRAPIDHWVLSCCRNGMTTMQTPQGLLIVPPGVPFMWSLGEQIESERTQVDRIQILLPRDMFQDIGPTLDAVRGTVIATSLGIVLGEYMLALERWLPTVTSEDLPWLGRGVRSMIAACLAPSVDYMIAAGTEIDDLRMERVRNAVRTHLRSPSLGPEALCKMLGFSRSSLYRLFENSGGIMHYIQRQRLLLAYAALSDPDNRQSILSISDDLCFADASSFSRAFRREFGCSPIEVRLMALKGNPVPPPATRPARSGEPATFIEFLRYR